MALTRSSSGRVSEETIQERVDKLGTGQPSTPLGATSIGASPNQAKMVGAMGAAAPAKEETLAGAQRLRGQRESTGAEEELAQRMEVMKKFGSLDQRVQQQVEGMLTEDLAAAGGMLSGAEVSGATLDNITTSSGDRIDESTRGKIKGYLMDLYSQERTSDQVVADLIKLSSDLGLNIAPEQWTQMAGLVQSRARERIGTRAAETLADNVFMSDIDVVDMGFESEAQAAQAVGLSVEDMGKMSVAQFQAHVEKVQQAEYSEVEALRNSINSLPVGSAQRSLAMDQLRAKGSVGITGVESEMDYLSDQVDMASEVEIGGEVYQVGDLLGDESISDLVTDYMSMDVEERDKLFPPGEGWDKFRSWLDANENSLRASGAVGEESIGKQREAQQGWDNFESTYELSDEAALALGIRPGEVVTSAQLAEVTEKYNSSSIGRVATGEGYSSGQKDMFKVWGNSLKGDDLDTFINLDDSEVETVLSAGEALKNPATLELVGKMMPDAKLEPGMPILDPELAAKATKLATVASSPNFTHIAADPSSPAWSEFLKLSPEAMGEILGKGPEYVKSYVTYTNTTAKVGGASDFGSKLSLLLNPAGDGANGEDVLSQISSKVDDLILSSKYGTDKEAAQAQIDDLVDLNILVDDGSGGYKLNEDFELDTGTDYSALNSTLSDITRELGETSDYLVDSSTYGDDSLVFNNSDLFLDGELSSDDIATMMDNTDLSSDEFISKLRDYQESGVSISDADITSAATDFDVATQESYADSHQIIKFESDYSPATKSGAISSLNGLKEQLRAATTDAGRAIINGKIREQEVNIAAMEQYEIGEALDSVGMDHFNDVGTYIVGLNKGPTISQDDADKINSLIDILRSGRAGTVRGGKTYKAITSYVQMLYSVLESKEIWNPVDSANPAWKSVESYRDLPGWVKRSK